MRGILKPLLLIFAILGSYVALAAWGFWAVMIRPGVVWVDIDARNSRQHTNLSVGVPAVIIDKVIDTVSSTARVSRWTHDHDHEIEHVEEWAPMIGAIARELENHPDFVLVEVDDWDDHVTVERVGGALLVRVEDGRDSVSIVLPQESSRRVLRKLGEI